MKFDYQSPYPSFQRGNVFGKLSTLFKIKDAKKFCVALQEVAGGKIRNVVVANDKVAGDILKAKVLRERVTFMPINKMQFRNIGKDQVDQIAQLTGGTARLAIDLIDYDPKFEPVMRQVFGTTFICDDQEGAKKICYNPRFAFVCVTLQGDKYEPTGGLHGGSVP